MAKTNGTGEDLGRACDRVLGEIKKSLDWTKRAGTLSESQKLATGRNLRMARREFRRLKRAATRPMCVAVFGPSQVGKSYLINSLSRHGDKSIAVRFGEETFDFLSDINPEGEGNEATGLVSRFSIRKIETPPGFPVQVRLHSLADIIKIIANSYFSDFDIGVEVDNCPTEEEITAALDSISNGGGQSGNSGLDEDSVLDIKEYVEMRFHGRRSEEMLRTTGFWDQFAALIPQLGAPEVETLVEFLWGRTPRLTELYRLLRSALERVRFSELAYCEIEALRPRERSIIDVNSLWSLGKSGGDAIRVKLPGGDICELARSEMTAIVAELSLTLDEKPHEYFDHTDLLDFPGYRPRVKVKRGNIQELEGETPPSQLFRRGKVDYLFDSYCRDQEVTALLLCFQPGNQDVHDIPPIVDRWVKDTHGSTPEKRKDAQTALFVVKTKFDMRFPDTKGSDAGSSERWRKAVQDEHLEFLGRESEWPRAWTPGKPFDNLFWIRNPEKRNHDLIIYDEGNSERESAIRDPETIEQFKQSYLAEPLIQTFVRDAPRAWDEALRLNDGGVSYLAEKLEPICNPDIKLRQVRTRFLESCDRITEQLSAHHVSDDTEEEREKREAAIDDVLDVVIAYAEQERFCDLISMIQIERDVMRRSLRSAVKAGGEAVGTVHRKAGASRDVISKLIRRKNGNGKPEGSGELDRSEQAAKAAVTEWSREAHNQIEQVSDLTHSEATVDKEHLRAMVREILQGANRLGVADDIAERLRDFTSDTFADDIFRDLQATIASEEINEFVWTLGFRKIPVEERPKLDDGHETPIFVAREKGLEDLSLGIGEDSHVNRTVASWLIGYEAMVKGNLNGGLSGPDDPESNRELGRIIGQLQALAQEA